MDPRRSLLFGGCVVCFGWRFCVKKPFLYPAIIDKESGFGLEAQFFEPSAGGRDGGCGVSRVLRVRGRSSSRDLRMRMGVVRCVWR